MEKAEQGRTAPWLGVALASALLTTLLDGVVLNRRFGLFSGGFLATHPLRGVEIPFFLLGSLWLDAAVATVFCVPALLITARMDWPRRPAAAAMLCSIPIHYVTCDRFDIPRYLGDVIAYRVLPHAGFDSNLVGIGLLVAMGLVAALATLWLVRFVPRGVLAAFSLGSRTRARALGSGAALVAGAVVMLALTGIVSAPLQGHFHQKTTGRWLLDLSESATDFDGDGFGLVRQPLDPAPLDDRIHPFALDRPANGLDEDGLGGDLDSRGDFSFEQHGPIGFARRPDLLLIVLETFRADNLVVEVEGKPVAPVLRRLIREGALTGPAYSHNAYTIESLSHLFTGTLSLRSATTLFDDFNANGYTTAVVSGQDESFGRIEQRTGMRRAHIFVDARDDVGERTSASTARGSLTVPWTVVARNVDDVLRRRKRDKRPVFMYVNLQDCHFPYTHAAIKPLLADDPVARSEITQENRERVIRTYRNTAANVDEAVGQILASWRAIRGRRPAFVIVSDHGESLFRDGLLGHGLAIDPIQTGIVFLVGGLGVECVFPLGLADVRGLVRRALSQEQREPKARVDPNKWVFQYTGVLGRPLALGAAAARGGVGYRLHEDAFFEWGDPPAQLHGRFQPLPRLWEQIQLRRAGLSDPDDQ